MKKYIMVVVTLLLFQQYLFASDFKYVGRQNVFQGKWHLELFIVRTNKSNLSRVSTCYTGFKFDSLSGLNTNSGITDESYGWSDFHDPPYSPMVAEFGYHNNRPPLLMGLRFSLTANLVWSDLVPWPANDTLKLWRISMDISKPWQKAGIAWYLEHDEPAYMALGLTDRNNHSSFPAACDVEPLSDLPLPVNLLSLNGSHVNNQIKLNWTTAAETNSHGFDVERSAINNRWEKLGFVASHGTTTASQEYIFIDKNLPAGTELSFRLKMIDMDGRFSYSQVLKIPVTGLPATPDLQAVYPNPITGEAVIRFMLPRDAIISIALYDLLGKEVRRLYENEALTSGSYLHGLDASGLANGKYFVKMNAGGIIQTQSIVLQR
jgi:hypothetical protein